MRYIRNLYEMFIFNRVIIKEFNRQYTENEYDNTSLLTLKSEIKTQFEHIINIYLNRKSLTQIILIILLFASTLLVQSNPIIFYITLTLSIPLILFIVYYNNKINSYYRGYKFSLYIANTTINTKFNLNIK